MCALFAYGYLCICLGYCSSDAVQFTPSARPAGAAFQYRTAFRFGEYNRGHTDSPVRELCAPWGDASKHMRRQTSTQVVGVLSLRKAGARVSQAERWMLA